MDRNRSQGQSGEIYNQQNAAYANQQSMQQMQNAFQSLNQNSYQTPANPFNNSQQKPGQLATPVYDMQNPYANLQATSQAQLQALQTNIGQQKELRKMQSEGYTGVTEAVRLYRSFGKSKMGDDLKDLAMGLPGVSSTVFSRRAEEIRSKVGSAAGRVSGKYAGALSGDFRHEKSAKTAALQMGESAFIDYMTGKIINQNYADPGLDASMVETVARKRAIDLMDFYVSQLPGKRIRNSADLEKMMRMADAVGGDIDIDNIGQTMQGFKQLGTEKALLDAQSEELNGQINQSRESALDLAYGNDQYDMPIEMDQEIMGAEQVESISFLSGVGEGLVKGLAKEGGSLLNTIGVNLFGKGAAIGIDLVGSAATGEIQTGARDTVHAISDKLNQMVAEGDPNLAESASRTAVKIFLAYTVGAAMLPAAGVLSATAAGGAMMGAGSLGQSAIGSVTGSIGDMLFGTEDNITPARELYDDISAVTAEGVTLWGMHKAGGWVSSKGAANFKDILSKTDSIKSIDPVVRDAILSAAEDVSAENMQKTFDSIQEMSATSGSKIGVDKVEGYSRLMEQQDHLKDSAAMGRAVQDGVKEIGTSILDGYTKRMGINSVSESTPKQLNSSIRELSETMTDSYKNSIGKAFGKNPDGSQKMVRLSEILSKDTVMNLDLPKNGTARDGLVNGIVKLGEEGIMDHKDAGRLARLIQNGKAPEAIDLINSIGEVNPIASHWLKSELGKGWIEGRNNTGVGELKRVMESVLENNMTQDQMVDYELAQSEYSVYKDVLKLFRNSLDEMGGKQDSVALSNKFYEVSNALDSLQARLVGENRSSEMIGNLSKLRDDLGLNLFYESISRRGKYTAETISSIRAKIEPSIANEGHKAAINTAADLMQSSAIRGTKSVGKTSTGTYRTAEWVSDIVSSWVLGLGKAGKNVAASVYKRLPGSESGLGREAGLKMAELTDIFINNPEIMKLVQGLLNDPILKKSRVSTNRMIFGLTNQSGDEEE